MSEDQWECESCKAINFMTNDLRSAICRGCRRKNQVIEYMIDAKQNQNVQGEEQEMLQHYKKG